MDHLPDSAGNTMSFRDGSNRPSRQQAGKAGNRLVVTDGATTGRSAAGESRHACSSQHEAVSPDDTLTAQINPQRFNGQPTLPASMRSEIEALSTAVAQAYAVPAVSAKEQLMRFNGVHDVLVDELDRVSQ